MSPSASEAWPSSTKCPKEERRTGEGDGEGREREGYLPLLSTSPEAGATQGALHFLTHFLPRR